MKRKGISLIVLIITIVVIIILAASIILNLTNSNMVGNAKDAVLKQDIATLKSELELYVSDRFVDEKGKYDRVKLNADYETATYGTESIADKNGDGESNVYDILTVLKKSKWDKKVYVKEGVLVFKNDDLSKEEIETILGTGVQVQGMPQIKEISAQSGYTNITISLDVEEADKVEKYIYIFNNGQREESTETIKTYTGLTADTNYMFEVIAVLSNGIEISKKQIISTKSLNGQIGYTPSETEWTNKDVTVTIEYSEEILNGYEVQYKLSGGMTQDWTAYTGPVTITENATTLVGRIYNSILEEEKVGSSIVISNIDKDVPTMPEELTLTAQKDSITATASGSKDVTSGVKHYEYSIDNKTWQTKDTFTGLEIGEYTVYARAVDMAGNVSEVKTGTVEVKIQIDISVEYVDLLNAKVTIDYGNVSNPEYKIGTNGTWQTYEDTFTINSQDIINKKIYNADYTLTVYARGTSSSGVQGTVNTVIDKIDLQVPEAPVITSSGDQYPIITETGVGITGIVSITYPENVKKLYSLDGENWKEYTESFESNSVRIYAKAVKESGLEAKVSVTQSSTATGALGGNSYDEEESSYDESTSSNAKKIYVSSEMKGKPIYIHHMAYASYQFAIRSYNSSGKYTTVETITGTNSITEKIFTIPSDSEYIQFVITKGSWVRIHDIKPCNEPTIKNTKYYPLLTEYGVESGYNEVEISYFQTSVQKLYKINNGEWQNYTGKVRVETDDIIYAKGIDKNGKEARIIPSYKSALPDDALADLAYDEIDTTYDTTSSSVSKKIYVSSEMQGKSAYMLFDTAASFKFVIRSYNSSGTYKDVKALTGYDKNVIFTVPTDSVYLQLVFTYGGQTPMKVFEICPSNEPILTTTKFYPMLTPSGVEHGYTEVGISYFETSVQKLYKINDGEWQNYTGSVKVGIDDTIYAKGVDKNGKDTRIIPSHKSALPEDSFTDLAHDEDETTYDNYAPSTHKKIYVSPEMRGKDAYMSFDVPASYKFVVRSYNSSGTYKDVKSLTGYDENVTFTVPTDSEYLQIVFTKGGTSKLKMFEIMPVK